MSDETRGLESTATNRNQSFRAKYLNWDEQLVETEAFSSPRQRRIYDEVLPTLRRLHFTEAMRDVYLSHIQDQGELGANAPVAAKQLAIRNQYQDNSNDVFAAYKADLNNYDRSTRQFSKSFVEQILIQRTKIVTKLRSRYKTPAQYEELAQSLALFCAARQDLPLILSHNQMRDPTLETVIDQFEEFQQVLRPRFRPDTFTDLRKFNTFRDEIHIPKNDRFGRMSEPRRVSIPDWKWFNRWSPTWSLPGNQQEKPENNRGPFPKRALAIETLYGTIGVEELREYIYEFHPIALMIPRHTQNSYRLADILRLIDVKRRNAALAGLINEICTDLENANRGIMADVLHRSTNNIDWRKHKPLYEISASFLAGDDRNKLRMAIDDLLSRIDEWTWTDIANFALFVIGVALFAATMVATFGGAGVLTAGILAAVTTLVGAAGFSLQFVALLEALEEHRKHGTEPLIGDLDPALTLIEYEDKRASAAFWLVIEVIFNLPAGRIGQGVKGLGSRARNLTRRRPAGGSMRRLPQGGHGPRGRVSDPHSTTSPAPLSERGVSPPAKPNSIKELLRGTDEPGTGAPDLFEMAGKPRPETPARRPLNPGQNADDSAARQITQEQRGLPDGPQLRDGEIPLEYKNLEQLFQDAEKRQFDELFNPPPTTGAKLLPTIEVGSTRAVSRPTGAAEHLAAIRVRNRVLRPSPAQARRINAQVKALLEQPAAVRHSSADALRERMVQRMLTQTNRNLAADAYDFVRDTYQRFPKLAIDPNTLSEVIAMQGILANGRLLHRRAAIREMMTMMQLQANDAVGEIRLLRASRASRTADFEVLMKSGPFAGELRQVEVRTITRSAWNYAARDFLDTAHVELREGALRMAAYSKLRRSSIGNGMYKQQVYDRGYIEVHAWGDYPGPLLIQRDINQLRASLRNNPNYQNIEGIYFNWRQNDIPQRVFVGNPNHPDAGL